jgi:hypothetical protein
MMLFGYCLRRKGAHKPMMLYVEELPAKEVRERLNMSRRRSDAAVEAIEQAENMQSIRWHDACDA